jgi:hypothetical protein
MALSRRNFVQLLGAAGISAAASAAFFDESAANAARYAEGDVSNGSRTPRGHRAGSSSSVAAWPAPVLLATCAAGVAPA